MYMYVRFLCRLRHCLSYVHSGLTVFCNSSTNINSLINLKIPVCSVCDSENAVIQEKVNLSTAMWTRPNVKCFQDLSLQNCWTRCWTLVHCMRSRYRLRSLRRVRCPTIYRRTSNYWIVLGKKSSVYRGTRGSRRSDCGPNENLKARLSSCR